MKDAKAFNFAQMAAAFLPALAFGQTVGIPPVKNYEANYVSVAPVLDGVIAPGEWNGAAEGGGDWGMLKAPSTAEDTENCRFKMVWDQNYLYVLYEADIKTWEAADGTPLRTWVPGGANGQGGQTNRNNINLYIDPNTDGEANWTPDPVDPTIAPGGVRRPDNQIDGYQIMWNQRIGPVVDGVETPGVHSIENQVMTNGGVYVECHNNQNGGNQARWSGLRKSRLYQITTPGEGNGPANTVPGKVVAEFALAWSDVDAPNRERFIPGPTGPTADLRPDFGTYHPWAPVAGEKWIFDISRINNLGGSVNLPIWSWHAQSGFNQSPHGTVEFKGGPRRYDVKYTPSPPVLDGAVELGEWDAAVESGDWGLLRKPITAEDAENSRFRMMWDKTYLYVLVQSDKTTWGSAGDGAMNFGQDNINFYFDPNGDGESTGRPVNQVDAYQIAWNQREGLGFMDDDGAGGRQISNTGFFLENHIDNGWGNQGRWQGLRQSRLAQKHGSTGGVIEFALAWADLDSPAPAQWAADPEKFPSDRGTVHPQHPIAGEEWIFNVSRISSDGSNFLPIWSWQQEQSFTNNPHGKLHFSGGPRFYQAQFTTVPPAIDGVVSALGDRGANEWGFASAEGGDWALLRQAATSEDAENSRFKMLWDNSYIYILMQTDKATWSAGNSNIVPFVPGTQIQGISFSADNLNIYLDPNVDGEKTFRGDGEVDGYQMAWNQYEGLGSFLDDGKGGRVFTNTGLFLEDHLNTPWGNNGRWMGLRQSEFVQNHGADGGVIELKLAWADLDAPGEAQFPEGLPVETGTAHPQAAHNGERFIFNISRISSDGGNLLPVWSWHGAQGFSVAPHGIVEFVGKPSIEATISPAADGLDIQFTSTTGNNYAIQWSTAVTDWITIADNLKGTGGVVTYKDTDAGRLSEPKGFYRAVFK